MRLANFAIRKFLTQSSSQNHQYALTLQDPFPEGWEPFFINCNDSSVEGIKSTLESGKRVCGVQFHPESAGGPLDTIEVRSTFLFDVACTHTALTDVYRFRGRVPSYKSFTRIVFGGCKRNLCSGTVDARRIDDNHVLSGCTRHSISCLASTMNYVDGIDLSGVDTPTANDEGPPTQTLNEEVNQVLGQLNSFWGGFRKQVGRTIVYHYGL